MLLAERGGDGVRPKQGKVVPRVPPLAAKNTILVFDDKGEVIGMVDPESPLN